MVRRGRRTAWIIASCSEGGRAEKGLRRLSASLGSAYLPGARFARRGTMVGFQLVRERRDTSEIRWIRSGALTASMIAWFGADSGAVEIREDTYRLSRRMKSCSLKIRGGERLDLKIARGRTGTLDIPGRARGTIESWRKLSVPFRSVLQAGIRGPQWMSVRKVRRIRRFALLDGVVRERVAAGDGEASCSVELTQIWSRNERLWTVGFEASGRPEAARRAIESTAGVVFGDPLPDVSQLGGTDAMSYAHWFQLGLLAGRLPNRPALGWTDGVEWSEADRVSPWRG